MHLWRRFGAVPLTLAVVACLACSRGLAAEPRSQSDAEAEIRRRAKEYLAAIERGNGEEIAAFWTTDGDYLDDAGQAVNGRQLAAQRRPGLQQQVESPRLTPTAESVRFVSPDVAIEDGTVRLATVPVGPSVVRRYTAIWVRRQGTWLLDGVRELAAPAEPRRDRLRDLAWMIGEWSSDDGGKTIRLTCAWSDDKHFLLRDIDVHLSERGPLHVTQRIGWDAREKQIKSWAFDSEGGHGDGLWFRKGDDWIVETQSVFPDGSRSTGTHIYSFNDADTFTWQVTHAEIDGEPLPDHLVRMVRQKASDEQ
ncbi:MAG TPA: nuclear transport factor 2 family protein [Pirellulales bacterium]|nr:nuclear transport factor 2 family protein [Pirellulales bacterium]